MAMCSRYGNTLREKTSVYKRMKQELGALRAEAVVLHRTEQILKGRDRNLEDFLQVPLLLLLAPT
jgi:intraflagellar transport protein 81